MHYLFLFSVPATVYWAMTLCWTPCYACDTDYLLPLSSPRKIVLLFVFCRGRDRNIEGIYNLPKYIKLANGRVGAHTQVCLILEPELCYKMERKEKIKSVFSHLEVFNIV